VWAEIEFVPVQARLLEDLFYSGARTPQEVLVNCDLGRRCDVHLTRVPPTKSKRCSAEIDRAFHSVERDGGY
jgi:hypothetical protein